VDAIPVTATGKVDRKPLRADRWLTGDAVWWRPAGADAYRRFDDADASNLHQEFVDAGREGMLT
jgi:fatty-acyl-CoA synthase